MYYDVCDYTNHNTCDCYRLKPLIKKYKAALSSPIKRKKHQVKRRMQITHHILKMRVLMMVMMTMMMAKDIIILVL